MVQTRDSCFRKIFVTKAINKYIIHIVSFKSKVDFELRYKVANHQDNHTYSIIELYFLSI